MKNGITLPPSAREKQLAKNYVPKRLEPKWLRMMMAMVMMMVVVMVVVMMVMTMGHGLDACGFLHCIELWCRLLHGQVLLRWAAYNSTAYLYTYLISYFLKGPAPASTMMPMRASVC